MFDRSREPFCPLYREALEDASWMHSTSAHAGLLFDKFADGWRYDSEWRFAFDKGKREKQDREKAEDEREGHWLKKTFLDRFRPCERLLAEACLRQRRLAEALGGQCVLVTNTSRFVTGMGREHPLENGFAWHPTLGVPYLPGSSLKGVVRAWCRDTESASIAVDQQKSPSGTASQADKWFGTRNRAGQVIVFDMLPLKPPQLTIDVMTPHYAPYYQQDAEDDLPGDWHSPIPIAFLTVEQGQSWQLGVAPAGGRRGIDAAGARQIVEALLAAIEVNGAGAKTAVGYGRFVVDHAAQEKLAREAERQRAEQEAARRRADERAAFEASLANDSEPLQRLKRLAREQEWKHEASDHRMLSELLRFAEKVTDPPQDCLDWIREWLHSIRNYEGVWENPEATKGKKNKPKYSSKQIRDLVRRLNPTSG